MSEKFETFDSPRRKPQASGSDSLLYSGSHQHVPYQRPPEPKQADQFPKAAGAVIGHASVWIFETMAHPFIVFRRSCQISPGSTYHLTPFTVPTVGFQLSRNKPPAWVYKGFISSLLTRGINMLTENVLNEVTNWPLAVSVYSSLKKQCFHLLLKWTGYLLCAPLYITSYVETVQSFGANDSPSLFEFLTEGCSRLFGRTYQHTWMVPMWTLLIPTATFRLCHYGVQQVTSHLVLRYMTEEKQATEMQDDSSVDYVKQTHHEQIYPGLVANFVSFLVADIVMFPCETVLHRLYIQGTRVLTDNMDHGREVLGVHFRYNGIFDCFWQILRDEGMNAFFRGFGALMLQYSCHFIGLRLISYALESVSVGMKRNVAARKR